MGALAVARAGQGRSSARSVREMLRAAPHRGDRTNVVEIGKVALGIVDDPALPEGSIAAADGMAVAFAGRLDNAPELHAELSSGRQDGGDSPAALIIQAFRRFGEDAAAHLRGAFSAAVTDGDRAWCFRDHVGFGNAYYDHGDGGFFAATEAKQVIAGSGRPREPDLEVVERIFYGNYDDDTPCAIKGVRRLPKAVVLTATEDGITSTRYWYPEQLLETARFSEDELTERFDELMSTAVRRTLTGRDAISLSGGIDSPAVAAYAAPAHQEKFGTPIEALSVVYPDMPAVDESAYVKLVCDRFGMPLHTMESTAGHLDRLDHWMRLADGPLPHTSVTQSEEVYLRARKLGFDTVLTGEIAEGAIDLMQYLIPHLLLHGHFAALARQIRSLRERGGSVASVARHLAAAFVPGPVAIRYMRARRQWIPPWIDRSRVDGERLAGHRPRERWLREQLSAFQGPGLGFEADEVCQAVCGVRTRRPWADVDLWEFFLSLPAEVKFPTARRKDLARKLLRGRVPDEILDRRGKTIFNDALVKSIDYSALLDWLSNSDFRMPGVDYRKVQEAVEARSLDMPSLHWASELAAVHAFLASW